MSPVEVFGVIGFHSRQQAIRFDTALKKKQIKSMLMSTPREIVIGCGLSVRFELKDMDQVIYAYKTIRPASMIGIYKINRRGNQSFVDKILI
jgi:hypothetical protein